jgi:predicted DsbA family dithiol-disulfide isomerase
VTRGNTERVAGVSGSVLPPTRIEVWADIVCSWCYVGKRHLETALEGVPEGSVELRWRSFELDPTLPADAGSADEELARRRGLTLPEARAMHEETERMGTEVGIRFDFARARRGNTFDAHRVLHMAQSEDRQAAVMDRLLAAYFGEGEPIGDRDALARVAGGGGLDPEAVSEMLAGDAYAADVRADEREAAELGITAVPFFVIDRRFGLAGAHPAETIREAIAQARMR